MTTYLDANALVRYYLMADGRESLTAALIEPSEGSPWPVPITQLLRFEV